MASDSKVVVHYDATNKDAQGRVAVFMITPPNFTESDKERLANTRENWVTTNSAGESFLHITSRQGYFEILANFPYRSVDLEARDVNGNTAVLSAASAKQNVIQLVDIFLKWGADIHAVNKSGNNALFIATLNGSPRSTLEMLVERQVQWKSVRNMKGFTILHAACFNGNLEALKYFIVKGANLEAKDNYGNTPILISAHARNNFIEIVDTLVEAGANINAVTNTGNNLIHLAVLNKRSIQDVRMIMGESVKWNATNYVGRSVLFFAAQVGNMDALKFFIRKGADVNAKSKKHGVTPLLVAVSSGKLDALRYLISSGADVSTRDVFGNTALLKALGDQAKENFPSIVKALVDAGCDINATDNLGYSMIFHAISQSRPVPDIELLLSHGVNVHSRDKNGNTILHLAVATDQIDVVKFLVPKFVNDVNIQNFSFETPLKYAVILKLENSKEIMNILIEAGADSCLLGERDQQIFLEDSTLSSEMRPVLELAAIENSVFLVEEEEKDGFQMDEISRDDGPFYAHLTLSTLSKQYVSKMMEKADKMPSFSSLF